MPATRDQQYAGRIFEQVSAVPMAQRAEYKGMAFKLPVLIHAAGLAQSVAFVQSRGNAALDQLLQDLAIVVGFADADALARRSRQAELPEYMHLTEKVLKALDWYKRFAQSVLKVTPTHAAQGEGAT